MLPRSEQTLRWFRGAPGQELLAAEAAACARELNDVFGAFGAAFTVQPDCDALLGDLELAACHGFVLDGTAGVLSQPVHSRLNELPIASESLRLVVVQHVLETLGETDTFLSECERVLAPGGALTVIGLNPTGRALRWGSDQPPWVSHWRSRIQVQRQIAARALVLRRARPVLVHSNWWERAGRGHEARWRGTLLAPVASAYLLVYRKPKHNGRVIQVGDVKRRAGRAIAGATPTVGSIAVECGERDDEPLRRASG